MDKDSVGNRIKILSYKRLSLGPINVKNPRYARIAEGLCSYPSDA